MNTIARIFMHLRTLPLLLAAVAPLVQAEPQTLTDKQGRSLKAEVISVTGDQVKIKRDDGQTFNLSLANLSDDDQKRLKEWAAKNLPADALLVAGAAAEQLHDVPAEDERATGCEQRAAIRLQASTFI